MATQSTSRSKKKASIAPVFGPDGKVFAAMSISGPASCLKKGCLDELVPDIKRISAAFSEGFGSS